MTIENARKELPMWAREKFCEEFKPMTQKPSGPWRMELSLRAERFLKRYGFALALIAAMAAYTALVGVITGSVVRRNTEIEVTERVTSEMRAGFQSYLEEQRRQEGAKYFLSGEASREAALNQEADAIARAIGPMVTKRMKQTMIWNILCRVDNPAYPNTVQEVIAQPQQWMFYTESNPIREDDRTLALEQLELWHEGRYPAGLSATYVYGEWSQTDYVLRDRWEKDSTTNYWRMPE